MTGLAHFELVHNWYNLLFQSMVRHFATSEVDLVPNENDGDLAQLSMVSLSAILHMF